MNNAKELDRNSQQSLSLVPATEKAQKQMSWYGAKSCDQVQYCLWAGLSFKLLLTAPRGGQHLSGSREDDGKRLWHQEHDDKISTYHSF